MNDRQSKIHSLGPRKMSSTGRAFYNSAGQNGFAGKPLLPVTTVPQPQIRYLLVQHPQFDTLVKQLTILRNKYDELLVKFEQKSTQQSLKANIQQVIESTHNIEARMSRIVQDANKMSNDQKQNQPTLQAQKARHQKQCLQIIQTVNKATEKIQELEKKNSRLAQQIQSQKQWKEGLQKQNKRLRLMLQNMESQKEVEIEKLKAELNQLKLNAQSQTLQENKPPAPQKRIQNSFYLQEHDLNDVTEEVSGFSRLTLNGQASRLSKIYE